MYGSYHHISALAADGRSLEHAPTVETVVAGPLCESGDVFTQQEGGNVETRALPEVKAGADGEVAGEVKHDYRDNAQIQAQSV